MTVIKHTRYICDVCQTTYNSEQSMTQVKFSYDVYDGKFDCCYDCMRGNEKMRSVYQKIIDVLVFWRNKGEKK